MSTAYLAKSFWACYSPKMTLTSKRSKASRTRGSDPQAPYNVPTVDTPGFFKPLRTRITRAALRGEEREAILNIAREMGRQALTTHEIAQQFDISTVQLAVWQAEDPVFAQALSMGRDVADARVERALYHKALGYSYPSEEIKMVNVERTREIDGVEVVEKTQEVLRVPTITHVPPDNTAMIFWLKNRKPDTWRDNRQVDVAATLSMAEERGKDPRLLAMAILAIMREAVEADNEEAATIEHEEAAE